MIFFSIPQGMGDKSRLIFLGIVKILHDFFCARASATPRAT